jgi:hypothetical protein
MCLRMHSLQKTLQDLSTLGKRRLRPFFLRLTGLCYNSIDSVGSDRVHKTQGATCCRTVALNGRTASYLKSKKSTQTLYHIQALVTAYLD